MRWPINLLEDGTVVTSDGEYLGTWGTDESDAVYQFTPDGASEVLFADVFKGRLCSTIWEWHEAR
jgi:hypothetical protein